MTPADDLPPLPVPYPSQSDPESEVLWLIYARDYALAARAERDALFETQRKTLESQRDELMHKCAERDERIKELERAVEHESSTHIQVEKTYRERAEAAEARLQNMKLQIIQIHAQDDYDTAGSMFETLVKELIERPEMR